LNKIEHSAKVSLPVRQDDNMGSFRFV